MSPLIVLLMLACLIYGTLRPLRSRQPVPLKLVSRTIAISPINTQARRDVIQAYRDAVDIYQTQCYSEHLARCALKSQHQFL